MAEIPNHNLESLLPERYPQHDLFICDVTDAILKDIIPQMEHPFYSLSKKPETAIRYYEHKGYWIQVVPSVKGLATIYDKDILIYAISQLYAKLNTGEKVSRRVRIQMREMLMFANRGTAGKDYAALCDALDRLEGTRIRTNIRRGDEEEFEAFGLINSARVVRKFGRDGRLLYCEIELSDWVFDAIRNHQALTLHRDYFRLRKPIERRVYELARKHCGDQDRWCVFVKTLHHKSGSQSQLNEFRRRIRELVGCDHLPDYRMALDEETDKVWFYNRGTTNQKEPPPSLFHDQILLDGDIRHDARLILDGWDVDYVIGEWRDWMASKGKPIPKCPGAAFLGFCREWVKRRGSAR